MTTDNLALVLDTEDVVITSLTISLFWNAYEDLNLEFLCHDDIVIDSEGI